MRKRFLVAAFLLVGAIAFFAKPSLSACDWIEGWGGCPCGWHESYVKPCIDSSQKAINYLGYPLHNPLGGGCARYDRYRCSSDKDNVYPTYGGTCGGWITQVEAGCKYNLVGSVWYAMSAAPKFACPAGNFKYVVQEVPCEPTGSHDGTNYICENFNKRSTCQVSVGCAWVRYKPECLDSALGSDESACRALGCVWDYGCESPAACKPRKTACAGMPNGTPCAPGGDSSRIGYRLYKDNQPEFGVQYTSSYCAPAGAYSCTTATSGAPSYLEECGGMNRDTLGTYNTEGCYRSEKNCKDGLDDNFDGRADCSDPSCRNACSKYFNLTMFGDVEVVLTPETSEIRQTQVLQSSGIPKYTYYTPLYGTQNWKVSGTLSSAFVISASGKNSTGDSITINTEKDGVGWTGKGMYKIDTGLLTQQHINFSQNIRMIPYDQQLSYPNAKTPIINSSNLTLYIGATHFVYLVNHNGQDWSPACNSDISGTHINISKFSIPRGCAVYVKQFDGSENGSLEVYANNIEIAGGLNGDGKGWRQAEGLGAAQSAGGGAGHVIAASGRIYGDETDKTAYMGSGGAQGSGGEWGTSGGGGGSGGAIIKLTAPSINISGNVTTNGMNGGSGECEWNFGYIYCGGGGGGGSGGTILIFAQDINISGKMYTAGGTGASAGRIKIFYSNFLDKQGSTISSGSYYENNEPYAIAIATPTLKKDNWIEKIEVFVDGKLASPETEAGDPNYNSTLDTNRYFSKIVLPLNVSAFQGKENARLDVRLVAMNDPARPPPGSILVDAIDMDVAAQYEDDYEIAIDTDGNQLTWEHVKRPASNASIILNKAKGTYTVRVTKLTGSPDEKGNARLEIRALRDSISELNLAGDVDYLNIFDGDLTAQCWLSCDPRTTYCGNAQNCTSYTTETIGVGTCTIEKPRYTLGEEDFVMCKSVCDTWNKKTFKSIDFDVWSSSAVVTVGKQFNLPIYINNKGLLADSYTINSIVLPIDENRVYLANPFLSLDNVKSGETKNTFVKITTLATLERDVVVNVTVSSVTAPWVERTIEIRLKTGMASLSEFSWIAAIVIVVVASALLLQAKKL